MNPATNPDVQEALSLVQGNKTVMILPLSSGKFAIFGRDFQLYEIWDFAPDAEALRELSLTLSGGKRKKIARVTI